MAEYTPYKVEVITPEGPAFMGEAQIVIVPGSAGELGVLAHHAPLVTSLKPGETQLIDAEGTRHEWATGNGFMQVRANEAMVLVGEAVRRDEIDAEAARRRLEQARAELDQAQAGDGDVYRAERELHFAEVLVRLTES
jgi:F-type H+-transporting ATPase subunit epsilon